MCEFGGTMWASSPTDLLICHCDLYRSIAHSITKLNGGNSQNIVNILAYKLSEAETYVKTIEPVIGGKEHHHLVNDLRIKWSKINLSNKIIEDSIKAVPGIIETDIGRILNFLLWAGLSATEVCSRKAWGNTKRQYSLLRDKGY